MQIHGVVVFIGLACLAAANGFAATADEVLQSLPVPYPPYRGIISGPEGSPGIPHRWGAAFKQAVGTAYEATGASSPLWFTIAQGVVTEVFYPTTDLPQVGDLQFLVTDGHGFFSEQKANTVSEVTYKDEGMVVHVTGKDVTGRYSFDQEIFSDTASPVLRIRTSFKFATPGLRVFVLFKPAINGRGSLNSGEAISTGLFATGPASNRGEFTHAALLSNVPWRATSAGFVGFSDGWQDISRNFAITQPWQQAGPGNIALTGELMVPEQGAEFSYELALGFGASRDAAQTLAQTSMNVPFMQAKTSYEKGWRQYLAQISATSGKRFIQESTFARRSAQIIKMHEDKRNRGAIVASLSNPAIPDGDFAQESNGGYHLVWPRDLYHAAMGLLAAGDTRTPQDVLHYYVRTQKPDGSWSQNFFVNGSPYWQGLQMDEASVPILLAAHLKRLGVTQLHADEMEMIRKAAAFIIAHGPVTQQDRWEEIGGYVPPTIAAEIAALRMTTLLTGDPAGAAVAQDWQSQLERWTFVTSGPLGKNYYLRVSPSGHPEDNEIIGLANGAGQALAPEILDGGFLELVRLGVRDAQDPRIQSTLAIYDRPDAGTCSGLQYRRYTRDGYGKDHVGGFWPLLAGERGTYAVAAQDTERARGELFQLESSSGESGLLPEQAPMALGVASPLVWAHAEDIILHRSLEEGTVFDTPREF